MINLNQLEQKLKQYEALRQKPNNDEVQNRHYDIYIKIYQARVEKQKEYLRLLMVENQDDKLNG